MPDWEAIANANMADRRSQAEAQIIAANASAAQARAQNTSADASAGLDRVRAGLLPAESRSNIGLQGANAGLARMQTQLMPGLTGAQILNLRASANQSNATANTSNHNLANGIPDNVLGPGPASAPAIGAQASVTGQTDKSTGAGFGYSPQPSTIVNLPSGAAPFTPIPMLGMPAPSAYRRPNYGLQQPVDISSSRPSFSKGMLGDPALDDAFHVRYAPVAR